MSIAQTATTSPQLLSGAVRHGLVTAEAVHSGRVLVCPSPRSNQVHRIELDGSAVAYCKQPGAAALLDGDDTVAIEQAVLTMLEELPFLPRVLVPEADECWTAPVAGFAVSDLRQQRSLSERLCTSIAQRLGESLGRLHGHPDRPATAPSARPPWPLLDQPLASMTNREGLRAEVLACRDEPGVAGCVRRARDAWGRHTWTHGDVSASNLFIDVNPGGDLVGLSLIDVEAAGLGSAAVDVVAALRLLEQWGLGDETAAARTFWAAYLAAFPRGQSPAAHWWCVDSLVRAWQAASASAHEVPELVARTRAELERARRCASASPVGAHLQETR